MPLSTTSDSTYRLQVISSSDSHLCTVGYAETFRDDPFVNEYNPGEPIGVAHFFTYHGKHERTFTFSDETLPVKFFECASGESVAAPSDYFYLGG